MLLSIIIPCFNSGQFIANTLNHLISQRLDECEIVAVNDGSTDDTLEILHLYAAKYPSIRVIDKKNGGVSDARNIGLQHAIGDYVYFLDSDDSLSEGTLDFFKDTIKKKSGKQMYLFGYEAHRGPSQIRVYANRKMNGSELDNQFLIEAFFSKKLPINICSVVYERKYLADNELLFPIGHKIGEDLEFIISAILCGATAFYSSRICFIYQINESGAMAGYKKYVHTDTLLYQRTLCYTLGNQKFSDYYNYWIAYNYVYGLRNFFVAKEKQSQYLDFYIENKYVLSLKKLFSFKFSVICLIVKCIPLSLVKWWLTISKGK